MSKKSLAARGLIATALSGAFLVVPGPTPAQAAEYGECTITAKADMGSTYIGGNTATWTCNHAKNVKVYLRAGALIAGQWDWKYKNFTYSSFNGTGSWKLPISVEGAAKLDAESKICYQWTTSVVKCRVASSVRRF